MSYSYWTRARSSSRSEALQDFLEIGWLPLRSDWAEAQREEQALAFCKEYWAFRTQGDLSKLKPQHLNAMLNVFSPYRVSKRSILALYKELKQHV